MSLFAWFSTLFKSFATAPAHGLFDQRRQVQECSHLISVKSDRYIDDPPNIMRWNNGAGPDWLITNLMTSHPGDTLVARPLSVA